MMNKQEMQAFRELFSKYCRQEINKGHCESDGCEFCSVNSAYLLINPNSMSKGLGLLLTVFGVAIWIIVFAMK